RLRNAGGKATRTAPNQNVTLSPRTKGKARAAKGGSATSTRLTTVGSSTRRRRWMKTSQTTTRPSSTMTTTARTALSTTGLCRTRPALPKRKRRPQL
ncbi:unnamed protein product, partial [Laminaria digitata]